MSGQSKSNRVGLVGMVTDADLRMLIVSSCGLICFYNWCNRVVDLVLTKKSILDDVDPLLDEPCLFH